MTAKEVRGNNAGSVASLGGLGLLVSFQFVLCVHLVPLWNERLVSNVPLCLCIVSEGRKEARASF